MLINYLTRLTESCRLCQQEGFRPTTCSGMDGLEGMLQEFQTAARFVCVSDTSQCTTFERGGAWYERRVYTVWVVSRYRFGDLDDYRRACQLCREVYRLFQSRMIRDRELADGSMLYLDTTEMRSNDLGADFLNNATGLYFLVTLERPLDLTYCPEEWNEPEP